LELAAFRRGVIAALLDHPGGDGAIFGRG
jgi:hypothetical protein